MYDGYEVKLMEGASLPLLSPLQDSLPPSFPFGCQPDFAKFFALSIPSGFEAVKQVLRYITRLRPRHFSVLPDTFYCRSENDSAAFSGLKPDRGSKLYIGKYYKMTNQCYVPQGSKLAPLGSLQPRHEISRCFAIIVLDRSSSLFVYIMTD